MDESLACMNAQCYQPLVVEFIHRMNASTFLTFDSTKLSSCSCERPSL